MGPSLVLAVVLLGSRLAAAGDWTQARGDAAGSAAVHIDRGGGRPLRAWRFQAGSHVWGYQPGISVWSSAAIAAVAGEPLIFIGSYDHNVYSLGALDGKQRWRYTTGGGVYAAPTVWRDPGSGETTVFAAASDRTAYALDASNGRRRWVHAIKSWRPTIGGARLSSPVVGRVGTRPAVFVGHWIWDKSLAGHLQAGGVTALDARTGRTLWTTMLGDNRVSSPLFVELAPGDRRLFVAAEDGNLHALAADSGRELWRRLERNVIKSSPAFFIAGGHARVVIGSKHGFVRCLDARDGRELWRFKTGHWVDGSAAIGHIDGAPVVFVGSYDTRLYALDGASGRALWSFRTAAGIYSSPALIEEGGRLQVLLSSWDHQLYCLDATDGALLWSAFLGRPLWDSVTLGDSTWASPSVASFAGRAMVYLGSYAGPLHALPLAAAQQAALRPGTNLRFWLTLPLVLLLVAALARYLTVREKARAASTTGPTPRVANDRGSCRSSTRGSDR